MVAFVAIAGTALFIACHGDEHEHVPAPTMTFYAAPLPPEPGKGGAARRHDVEHDQARAQDHEGLGRL